jgi:hypothetical protein
VHENLLDSVMTAPLKRESLLEQPNPMRSCTETHLTHSMLPCQYSAVAHAAYYASAYPGYGYGGYYRPGYRAARRVAIHRARWH